MAQNLGRDIFYSVKTLRNKRVYVDIRHFVPGADETLRPTKKGVCLSLDEWRSLKENIQHIEQFSKPIKILSVYNGALVGSYKVFSSQADVVYSWRPQMSKFCFSGLSILVFTSLKFRVFDRDPHRSIFDVIPLVSHWLSTIDRRVVIKYFHRTNSSLRYHLGHHVNLPRLAQLLPLNQFIYEPELISYLQLRQFSPVNINLFSTGSVIIMGRGDLEQQLPNEILPFLHSTVACELLANEPDSQVSDDDAHLPPSSNQVFDDEETMMEPPPAKKPALLPSPVGMYSTVGMPKKAAAPMKNTPDADMSSSGQRKRRIPLQFVRAIPRQ